MYDSKIALQTRAQLEGFLGMFSPHFSVPLLKFIGQMLFGIQAAKSVLLTRIGHELREGTTPKKTEERHCRNPGTASLGAPPECFLASDGADSRLAFHARRPCSASTSVGGRMSFLP